MYHIEMRLNDYFNLQEFVPREIHDQFGDKSIWFIDPRIIRGACVLRHLIGEPIVINDWYIGGDYNYSGFRPLDCPVGSKYSQHKFGRAIDVKAPESGNDYLRGFIYDNWYNLNSFFTTVELDTNGWVHLDNRTWPYVPKTGFKPFEVNG